MHNYKTPCSSKPHFIQTAVNGDNGPNGKRDERYGKDNGKREE
jgi:hypothetical protein